MKRAPWTSLFALSLLFAASPARAEDSRAAYADHLFREGLALMKQDKCVEAIPKFLSSQQIDESAGTLMNLATCYARVGRTAAAWRTYRQAATEAESEKADDLKAHAFQALSLLMTRVTKLRIIASRSAAPVSLTLNGEPLTVEEGFPIPLDPGENILEAVAPGRQPWRRSVNAAEIGATIVIEVPDLPAVPKQEPRVEKAPERDGSSNLRIAAVLLGGAGLSGIVAGSILGLSAKHTYDQSSDDCRDDHCNARGHDLRADAIDKARIATYAVGLGSLVAAGGVVLWFAAPSRAKRTIEVGPWIPSQHGAWGLTLEGAL
jgi:serine/threonine-protein kinase